MAVHNATSAVGGATNKITVSWEIAKYLLPEAMKGEPEAVLMLCKLACPDWSDVALEDFTVEQLGGGFSGNVPSKCTAKGKSGSLAFKIIPPEEDEEEEEEANKEEKMEEKPSPTKKIRTNEQQDAAAADESMCGTAFRLWGQVGIVPAVHLLGNPKAPGVEIYEFIDGRSASWQCTKHGPEFMHDEKDAASFGKLIGTLHAQPSDWYKPFQHQVKPQWESWQAGMKTNVQAREMRELFGDYASLLVLFCDNFSKGKNATALSKSAKELYPLLHRQLDTNSLLGRMVIGHGDCHGANLMHRSKKEESHGDLVAIDLDFVGRYPAAVDLGTALGGTTSGPYGYFFNKGEPMGEYPSLKNRRLVAKAYLQALGDSATRGFTRSSMDEVVFDMEIGAALRVLWALSVFLSMDFIHAPVYGCWGFLHFCKACLNIFEQCKTDEALKQRVVEEGVAKVYTDHILELGVKPMQMMPEQYQEHWDVFGSLGPAFAGPFLPDDPPVAAATEDASNNSNKVSSFQAAAFRLYESTGADIKSVFDRFDTDGNGTIDLQELMGCAVVCGVGFTSLQDAEKAFAHLDTDGDGSIDFEEFKAFLHGC